MKRRDFLRLSAAAFVGATFQRPLQSFGRIPLAKQTLRFPPVLNGLIVPWLMDGHPMHQIQRGQTYDYDFYVVQRAGTYFYHSHTLHLTAEQTYRGIGGFFIVHDDEEENLGLPHGDFDIPLALQDRRPNSDRQAFSYNPTISILLPPMADCWSSPSKFLSSFWRRVSGQKLWLILLSVR